MFWRRRAQPGSPAPPAKLAHALGTVRSRCIHVAWTWCLFLSLRGGCQSEPLVGTPLPRWFGAFLVCGGRVVGPALIGKSQPLPIASQLGRSGGPGVAQGPTGLPCGHVQEGGTEDRAGSQLPRWLGESLVGAWHTENPPGQGVLQTVPQGACPRERFKFKFPARF